MPIKRPTAVDPFGVFRDSDSNLERQCLAGAEVSRLCL